MNLNKEFNRILVEKFGLTGHDYDVIWQFVLESYSTKGRFSNTLTNMVKRCQFLNEYFKSYEFYETMFIALVFEGVVHDNNSSESVNTDKSFSLMMFMLDDLMDNETLKTILSFYRKSSEVPILNKVYNTINLMFLNDDYEAVLARIEAIVKERNYSERTKGVVSVLTEIKEKIALGVLDDPKYFDLDGNLAKIKKINLDIL